MATLLTDDTFNRADSSVGGVGNSWTDSRPAWQIQSGKLKGNTSSFNIQDNFLLRPEMVSEPAAIVSLHVASSAQVSAILRANPSTKTAYIAMWNVLGQLIIGKVVNGAWTALKVVNASYPGDGDYYVIFAAQTNGSTTDLTAKVYAVSNPSALIASATVSDSTAALQGAGQSGITHSASSVPVVSEFRGYDFSDHVLPSLSSAPLLGESVAVSTSLVVNLSSPGATLGSSPYTYQWHRSTVSGFTPSSGTVLSGAMALAFSDTSAIQGQQYFYKLVVTDSASGTAISNQVAARLLDNPLTTIKLGFIGDSITGNLPNDQSSSYPPPTAVARYLGRMNGLYRDVTTVVRGFGGAISGDWIPGAASGYLTAAKTAFAAAGVTHVLVCLGANDSSQAQGVSAASYKSHLQAMCDDLVAAGYKVILNYPTYIKPGSLLAFNEASVALLQAFQAQIDSLVNGTTVLQGDVLGFRYFQNNLNEYVGTADPVGLNPTHSDWVHPNAKGIETLGYLWAQALIKTLTPSGPQGTVIFNGNVNGQLTVLVQ